MFDHYRQNCSIGIAALVAALTLMPAMAKAADEREAGEYFLQQYSPKIYGSLPQNWDAVQDERGVMFFANSGGVLEYDGAKWRHIEMNGLPALSLAVGGDHRIYVGSEGDFGYLKPDANGLLSFTSLQYLVPNGCRRFGKVWSVHSTSEGIWFRTRDYIFRLSPAMELRTVMGQQFRRAFVVDDVYHVTTDDGLFEIRNLKLNQVTTAKAWNGKALRSYFHYNGATLALTNEGFFRRNAKGFSPWKTQADAYLHSAIPNLCVPLANGQLAVATLRGGVLTINKGGTIGRIIDQDQALRSLVIHNLYEDHDHGLWLALDRGLARVDVEAPITSFGAREGVQEIVDVVRRVDGRLFAGTQIGVSYLDVQRNGSTPTFRQIDGIDGMVYTLLPLHREAIAGTQRGLYSISKRLQAKAIQLTGAVLDLAPSPSNPDIFFAAGRGLYVLQRQGSGWKQLRKIEDGDTEFRTVLEDRDGWIWATTRTGAKLINWKVEPALIRNYEIVRGSQLGYVNAYRLRSGIVMATPQGLRRFDVRQQRFIPDERFGARFADGSHRVSIIREDRRGNVWISGDAYHGLLRRTGAGRYEWEDSPLARTGIQEIYSLYIDEDQLAWASGADGGVVRYRDGNSLSMSSDPLLIRTTVALDTKKAIYGGESATPQGVSLPYRENALRFEFAYPHFGDESRTSYQVRLEGLDRGWSAWSLEAEKEYTNLPESSYKLRIRARDVYGRVSPQVKFEFSVLPPWYRTWWAYALYAALAACAIFLFVKWRLAQMANNVRRLERMIDDRTLEVRQQRDKIQEKEEETEALLLNILPASIAEELRETGEVKPQAFGDVAVCFTDFVAFTLASEKLSPSELVHALHTYFTAFDEIIDRYGLEKLKTIGDAYMFVGGLPSPSNSFAVDALLAAMEVVATVEELSRQPGCCQGWQVRIGMHCGPAVAGVVGKRKFAFDIWGETVNLASRLEMSSLPNRLNISQDAYALVKEFVTCEPRGPVRTKEGRLLNMYFARHILAEEFVEKYRAAFGKEPPEVKLPRYSEAKNFSG